MQLFDLTGQTALITGASMGIGFALARGLGQAGAKVVLNARNIETLETAANTLRDDGITVDTLPFDVTDHDAVAAQVNAYETNHGPITILINNAGMQHRTALEDFPADAFEQLMKTNVNSVFHVGQGHGHRLGQTRAEL
jgi:gluconate 5-dehydrogenase